MKAVIKDNILYIEKEDLPQYQKGKSIVRNNYYWALKSISDYAPKGSEEIWTALNRMLLFFTNSGYLGLKETTLEFSDDTLIPDALRSSSSKL